MKAQRPEGFQRQRRSVGIGAELLVAGESEVVEQPVGEQYSPVSLVNIAADFDDKLVPRVLVVAVVVLRFVVAALAFVASTPRSAVAAEHLAAGIERGREQRPAQLPYFH